MTPDPLTQLLVIAAGLLAIIPGWLLATQLYFASRWPWFSILLVLLVTGILLALALYVPFAVDAGKQDVDSLEMLTDVLIFGAVPLGLLALVGYVLDHLQERPLMVLLASSACFAIALLPIAFFFFEDRLQAHFQITMVINQAVL
jgi:hypothetical protein